MEGIETRRRGGRSVGRGGKRIEERDEGFGAWWFGCDFNRREFGFWGSMAKDVRIFASEALREGGFAIMLESKRNHHGTR